MKTTFAAFLLFAVASSCLGMPSFQDLVDESQMEGRTYVSGARCGGSVALTEIGEFTFIRGRTSSTGGSCSITVTGPSDSNLRYSCFAIVKRSAEFSVSGTGGVTETCNRLFCLYSRYGSVEATTATFATSGRSSFVCSIGAVDAS